MNSERRTTIERQTVVPNSLATGELKIHGRQQTALQVGSLERGDGVGIHHLSVTRIFPRKNLRFAQLRRAEVSVPSNIAEGAAWHGSRELAHFLNVAIGSISEIETQLLIAADLDYLAKDDPVFTALEQVSKLVTGLRRKVSGNEQLTTSRSLFAVH